MGVFHAKPSSYVADQWIADADAPECYGCREPFTMSLRRHHCRCCGEVFCAECWGRAVTLPKEYAYDAPVKVCRVCESMFVGSLQFLRLPRRIVLTRHSRLPRVIGGDQEINSSFGGQNTTNSVSGRQLNNTRQSSCGSVVQTDRSFIVTGSSRCLDSQLNRQTSAVADYNCPPLSKSNMRTGSFEVFFVKLVQWRPFDHITHLQFSITLRAASGNDSSNFSFVNEAVNPDVRLCGGRVVAADEVRGYSQCGTPGGYQGAPISDVDEQPGRFRKKNKTHSNNNFHKNVAASPESMIWGLPLGSFRHVTYDFHEEGDYITLETTEESLRVQVADIFAPGDEGAKAVHDHRYKMTASGREIFDEIYQGSSRPLDGSSSDLDVDGGGGGADGVGGGGYPDLGFLSAFAAGNNTYSGRDAASSSSSHGDHTTKQKVAPKLSSNGGRNLRFNAEDVVQGGSSFAEAGDTLNSQNLATVTKGAARGLSKPLKGTRYVVNPEDTAKLFVELQELLKMARGRNCDGTSTNASSYRN